MKIPILRVSFPPESQSFIGRAINEAIRSGVLTSGRFTRQFEELFSAFTGARHAVACSSGTSALELILRGLGLENRSVIVPTNTFLATALAVMHAGNRVIFADSDPATLALDPADVRRRLQEDTAAVILVHIGGIVSPAVYELQQLCRERGLYFIEDAAHAHGCTLDGRHAGTLGIAGAFSFFPTKVLTTGEGGIITTNDEGLAREIHMLRNHGKNPALGQRMSAFGNNHRLSELAAIMGVDQMRRAPDLIGARQRAAAFYDERLQVADVRPVRLAATASSSYYKYIVYLDQSVDRATLKAALEENHGVALPGEVYADLCHTEPLWEKVTYCGHRRNADASCGCWPTCGTPQEGFPGAEYISGRHACLPIYPSLTAEELEHVVASIEKVLAEIPAAC